MCRNSFACTNPLNRIRNIRCDSRGGPIRPALYKRPITAGGFIPYREKVIGYGATHKSPICEAGAEAGLSGDMTPFQQSRAVDLENAKQEIDQRWDSKQDPRSLDGNHRAR